MTANFGATPVGSTAIIPLLLGPKVQTTVYHVPAVDFHVRGVLTNTMATGAYRGAGRPEANYLMERLIEQAAREMKLDPAEMRRRNLIAASALPYRTHLGDTYDSGDFARILDRVLAASDWNSFEERKNKSKESGKLRGRGLAVVPGVDRRDADRDGGHRSRGRRHRDGVLRDHGDGAGAGDELHAAHHRSAAE